MKKPLEIKEQRAKYGIGKKFQLLDQGTPVGYVETCIGNHSNEDVERRAKIFANADNMLYILQKLEGGSITPQEITEIEKLVLKLS